MRMRFVFVSGWPCVAVALAVLFSYVSSAGGAAAGGSTPVLLAEGPAEVFAVAVSSRYVAWRTCNTIQVRDLRGRRYPLIRLSGSGESRCQVVTSPDGSPSGIGVIDRDLLALFDGAVTWSQFSEGNSTDYLKFGAARISSGGRMA